jgi:spore coat protein CotH
LSFLEHLSGMRLITRIFLSVAAMTAPAAWGQTRASMSDLLDDAHLHEIHLSVDAADWNQLRENFTENTYYAADLRWRDITLKRIGIRSRGNGSRSGVKPGLKLDFNEFVSGQEFLGLKSLVLDNLTQDATMLKERLMMKLFRRMAIPAPRVAHTKLFINGEYWGLYTLVEPVDKGFLKRNLGEDGGYLYDYEWSTEYRFEDLGPDAAAYTPYPFQLETNESKPNPQPLIELIQFMNQASDEEFAGGLARHLDPASFLRFLAVEAFAAEQDGFLGDWGMNNFYLYGYQNSPRFVFVPWDKDLAFAAADRSAWENVETNVLARRMLAVPEWREFFVARLRECAASAGGPGGWFEQELEAAYQQITRAAAEDSRSPFTYAEFEGSIDVLRHFAFTRSAWVVQALATPD